MFADLLGGECMLGATTKNRLAESGRIIVHPAGMFPFSNQTLSHSSEHAQFIDEECFIQAGRDEGTPSPSPRPVRFPDLRDILIGDKE